MHRLEIRRVKRTRSMVKTMDYETASGEVYYDYHLPRPHGLDHAPNAIESRVIRQMRAKFHINEQELRACKRFRKMLASAVRAEQCTAGDPLARAFEKTMRKTRGLTNERPWHSTYESVFAQCWEQLDFAVLLPAKIAYNNLARQRGWNIDAGRTGEIARTT